MSLSPQVRRFLWSGVFTLCALAAGCAVHAGYYNDPYYHDRHPIAGETVYYEQWEHDNHREHVDLNRRSKEEQRQYWEWRHKHEDHHD